MIFDAEIIRTHEFIFVDKDGHLRIVDLGGLGLDQLDLLFDTLVTHR
jgi:hypothetical protein